MELFEFGDYQTLPPHIDIISFKSYLKEVWNNRYLFYESSYTDENIASEEQKVDISRQGQALLKFDGNDIQTRNYAGFIHYNGSTFYLLPKIFRQTDFPVQIIFKHLLYYLSYSSVFRFPFAKHSLDTSGHDTVLQLFVHLFAAFTEETLTTQPYQAYEEITTPTTYMRGKLQVTEYMRNNLSNGQWQELQIQYTPLQFDNTFNQVVKYTATKLLPIASEKTLPLLQSLLFTMNEVSEQTFTVADCDKITINRLHEDHQQILQMCRYFLANEKLCPPQQTGQYYSFLVPMERVFELFVTGFIQQHFPGLQPQVQSREYLATLQGQKAFQIRNDVWLSTDAVIIDMKYQLLTESEDIKKGVSQIDLYQMIAYAIGRKSNRVHLIYPNTTKEIQEPFLIEIENGINNQPIRIFVHQISVIVPDVADLNHTSIAALLEPNLKKQLSEILFNMKSS